MGSGATCRKEAGRCPVCPCRGVTHLEMAVHKDSISIRILAPAGRDPGGGQDLSRRGCSTVAAFCRSPPVGWCVMRPGRQAISSPLLLSILGRCEVMTPALIPRSAADRVKTEERDYRTLAHLHAGRTAHRDSGADASGEAIRNLRRALADIRPMTLLSPAHGKLPLGK